MATKISQVLKDTNVTGDVLRNFNSWDYLKQFKKVISNLKKIHYLPAELFYLLDNIDEQVNDEYDANTRYGNLYTKFLTTLEKVLPDFYHDIKQTYEDAHRDVLLKIALIDNVANPINEKSLSSLKIFKEQTKRSLEKAVNNRASKKRNFEHLIALVNTIYVNTNFALENSGDVIKDIVDITDQTSKAIESQITSALSHNEKTRNNTTPQEQGSNIGRFSAMMSNNFKPQLTTSLASVRKYHFSEQLLGQEIRFGTQGQRHDGQERVGPLFELWLDCKKPLLEDQDDIEHPHLYDNPPRTVEGIQHVYFNNLGFDRNDFEGNKERRLSEQLHDLENRHDNIAVISIPADKGIMDKKVLTKKWVISVNVAKKILKTIAMRTKDEPGLDLSQWIDSDKFDFYMSPEIKRLVYTRENYQGIEEYQEERIITELTDKSFEALGLDGNAQLSYAELQAVFFHFMKFELTNDILTQLKPETYNMSCKDAIDRGGVSSAYYNLIKSIKIGNPMTKEEFNRALHAAPTLVKGRGMNHHTKLIWNAVNQYLSNLNNFTDAPDWLSEWRFENCPNDKAKEVLHASIDAIIHRLEVCSDIDEALIINAIESIQKAQTISDGAKPSAYGMIYQMAMQTENLIYKIKAYNLDPEGKGNKHALEAALTRYDKLSNKAASHYGSVGKSIQKVMKLIWCGIASIFSSNKAEKIQANIQKDKSAKEFSQDNNFTLFAKGKLQEIREEPQREIEPNAQRL